MMNAMRTHADPAGTAPHPPPPAGTVERWCFELVHTRDLEAKLAARPPDLDDERSWEPDPPARRASAPGRPVDLEIARRSPPAPRLSALTSARARAQLFHTFAHHELQAAELFAWALLAFPSTPRAFRAGLVRLAREELAHLRLYRAHMRTLGLDYGAQPVRDWFWERVATCASPLQFVALQGLGLEGANLEHTARYAARFREVGDDEGASILSHVESDEVAHVAFAAQWFAVFAGAPLDFDRWSESLPPPLTPALLQGRPLNRDARTRAGFDAEFLARLANVPDPGARSGSPRSVE